MSKEIMIENEDYTSVFILDNGKDYDICQLFKKDTQYDKTVLLNSWVRLDFFNSTMKNKDEEIAALKKQLMEKELIIYRLSQDDKNENKM